MAVRPVAASVPVAAGATVVVVVALAVRAASSLFLLSPNSIFPLTSLQVRW